MTRLDLLLQNWRIRRIGSFLENGARVLDIGCSDGTLFRRFKQLRDSAGIDPDLHEQVQLPNAVLYPGFFPPDLPDMGLFDAITMLAVLEHIPEDRQVSLARDCFQRLRPGGKVIITVPSPQVDNILAVLGWLHLVDGIHVEQHYGFDVKGTKPIFQSAGFELLYFGTFQLKLNNLFVFVKPLVNIESPLFSMST